MNSDSLAVGMDEGCAKLHTAVYFPGRSLNEEFLATDYADLADFNPFNPRNPWLKNSFRAAGVQEIRAIVGPAENAVPGAISQAAQLFEIDAGQPAFPHHDPACDENGVDVARVHERDNSAGCVV